MHNTVFLLYLLAMPYSFQYTCLVTFLLCFPDFHTVTNNVVYISPFIWWQFRNTVSFCPVVYPGLSWVHLVLGIHWDGPHGWIYVSGGYICASSFPSLVLFFPLWQGIQMCVTSQCQCIAGLYPAAGEMRLLLFLHNRFSFPLPFLVSIMSKCWILSWLFTGDILSFLTSHAPGRIMYVSFWMLRQPCISRINSSWSCPVVSFMYAWS